MTSRPPVPLLGPFLPQEGLEFSPEYMSWVISLLPKLAPTLSPPLGPRDVVGVTLHMVVDDLMKRMVPDGRPLEDHHLLVPMSVAVELVHQVAPRATVATGFASPLILSYDAHVIHMREEYLRWHEEAHRIQRAAASALKANKQVSATDHILGLTLLLMARDDAFADEDALLGDVAAARKMLGLEVDDQNLGGDVLELLSKHKPTKLLFKDRSGKLRLGKQQVRSKLKSKARVERDGREFLGRKLPPPRSDPPRPLDLAEDAEAKEALAAAVAARLARAPRGSGAWVVLTHLMELLEGRVSLSDLADRYDMGVSTLSEARKTLLEGLARELAA